MQIGKEEAKVFSFEDNMILHMKDPKNYTKKLIGLMNTFSPISGYTIEKRNQ